MNKQIQDRLDKIKILRAELKLKEYNDDTLILIALGTEIDNLEEMQEETQ